MIAQATAKHKQEKTLRTFARGFTIGCGGGALMYAGKKTNILIARQKNISPIYLTYRHKKAERHATNQCTEKYFL
jgi:hypothetical protein